MPSYSKNDPLVSICTITYNHEKYISQAIDSFLMQKTGFDYEIVIADDGSTDENQVIIRKYLEKNQDKFNAELRDKNIGMQKNFIDALSNCKGKYIALCEGDDYWTDSLKLQKQVDFLESNPDFSMCSHAVDVIFEDDWTLDKDTRIKEPIQVATFEDILERHFISTNSLMFRNGLIKKWPKWFHNMLSGDIPLELMLAYHGKSYFFYEKMGVKRINGGGITANPQRFKKMNKFRADLYYYINQYSKYKYRNILYPKIFKTSKGMIKEGIQKLQVINILNLLFRILHAKVKPILFRNENQK